MTDEIPNDAAQATATDSLRDTIARAVESQRESTPRTEVSDTTLPEDGVPHEGATEKPKDQTGERNRDEHGRFAKTETAPQAPKAPEPAEKKPEDTDQPPQEPVQQHPAVKPPVGWPADAKAEFAKLPPHVQQAVAKREEEVNRGFAILQKYKGLEEYDPYLQANGTTHAEVMKRALDWEKALANDPVGTVRHVVNLTRMDPRLVAQALVNPQAPAPRPQPAPQPQPQPINIQAEIDRALRERETQSTIDKFLSDPKNEHAPMLVDDMAAFITAYRSLGKELSLEDAYQKALFAHPEIREQLINQRLAASAPSNGARQQQAAIQARNAAKAVTGAPSGGKAPPSVGAEPKSTRDVIRQAIEDQRQR